MTVILEASTPRYIGLAADTKPTAPPAGSLFYETDTGVTYIYDGSAWVIKTGAAGGGAGASRSVAVSLTRTNDTNAYNAGDVLGAATDSTAALTFANIGPNGGEIMLTTAELEIDASGLISGEASYRLYLYNVTPPSALGDNAAWDLSSSNGDRASFLGYVDLGTPVDLGNTLYVQTTQINKQVKLASSSLFAYLVTIGAYTPTASRVHKITLHAVAL